MRACATNCVNTVVAVSPLSDGAAAARELTFRTLTRCTHLTSFLPASPHFTPHTFSGAFRAGCATSSAPKVAERLDALELRAPPPEAMRRLIAHRFRYVVLLVGSLCLTSISSNHLAFNIGQICMGSASFNDTDTPVRRRRRRRWRGRQRRPSCLQKIWGVPLNYSPYDISLINWSVAVGTAVATFPFSSAYLRRVIMIVGASDAVSLKSCNRAVACVRFASRA